MHWRTHLQASILGAVAGAHLVRCLAPAYGIPAWETQGTTDGGLTKKPRKIDESWHGGCFTFSWPPIIYV